MALYGVLGDIHGNREALAAVLDRLDAQGVTRLLCVGDVVGYNADPDACTEMLRARGAIVIAGNHDLIGTGRLGFERCSNKARYSLSRTRKILAPETAAWLRTLPASRLVEDSIALVHGGVRDVQMYMTTRDHIRANAELLREDFPGARVCFFGHSHAQKLWDAAGDDLPLGTPLEQGRVYFINAGSVDAQRKRGERQAECAIFDSGAWSVRFLRLAYDAAATEAKAALAGYRIPPIVDLFYTLRARM